MRSYHYHLKRNGWVKPRQYRPSSGGYVLVVLLLFFLLEGGLYVWGSLAGRCWTGSRFVVSPVSCEIPPLVAVPAQAAAPSPSPTPDQDCEAWTRQIFGDEADIALAVGKAESGLQIDRVNKWWNGKRGEWSVGCYQINIYAHRGKIPGKIDLEREVWLKVPKNNVMMAKIIKDASGWTAWTGYTSGRWKEF